MENSVPMPENAERHARSAVFPNPQSQARFPKRNAHEGEHVMPSVLDTSIKTMTQGNLKPANQMEVILIRAACCAKITFRAQRLLPSGLDQSQIGRNPVLKGVLKSKTCTHSWRPLRGGKEVITPNQAQGLIDPDISEPHLKPIRGAHV
ncbi:MAG: hypothetical protein QXI19_06770 [Candidatus Caldarchaeum sp.]